MKFFRSKSILLLATISLAMATPHAFAAPISDSSPPATDVKSSSLTDAPLIVCVNEATPFQAVDFSKASLAILADSNPADRTEIARTLIKETADHGISQGKILDADRAPQIVRDIDAPSLHLSKQLASDPAERMEKAIAWPARERRGKQAVPIELLDFRMRTRVDALEKSRAAESLLTSLKAAASRQKFDLRSTGPGSRDLAFARHSRLKTQDLRLGPLAIPLGLPS